MWYSWILGAWRTAGYVALTSLLMYVSVVVGLRLGERRTLAQMTVYDFTVAVALGAVVGRTVTSTSPSYVQGLVATVALLATHNLLSIVRLRFPGSRRILDHRPVVVMRHGRFDEETLRSVRLTHDDIRTVLREHGVGRFSDVALVVLEGRGAFSVIREADGIGPEMVPGNEEVSAV